MAHSHATVRGSDVLKRSKKKKTITKEQRRSVKFGSLDSPEGAVENRGFLTALKMNHLFFLSLLRKLSKFYLNQIHTIQIASPRKGVFFVTIVADKLRSMGQSRNNISCTAITRC